MTTPCGSLMDELAKVTILDLRPKFTEPMAQSLLALPAEMEQADLERREAWQSDMKAGFTGDTYPGKLQRHQRLVREYDALLALARISGERATPEK